MEGNKPVLSTSILQAKMHQFKITKYSNSRLNLSENIIQRHIQRFSVLTLLVDRHESQWSGKKVLFRQSSRLGLVGVCI